MSEHVTADKIADQGSWRCFHCDAVFTDRRAAWEHFGNDYSCTCDVPACIDPLRTDEKERNKELREAREYANKMRLEVEANDEAISSLESMRSELGRYFGKCGGFKVSTPHQAYLVHEAVRNERNDAQATLARLKESLQSRIDATPHFCCMSHNGKCPCDCNRENLIKPYKEMLALISLETVETT